MSLTKSGNGVLALAGANGYSGGTSIGGGTLQVGSSTALGSGWVNLYAGALDLNGQSLGIGALSGALGSTITSSVGGAATLTTSVTTGSQTFAGVIQNGSGSVSLVKNGAEFVLSNANTFGGGVTVNNGTFVVSNSTGSATGSGNVTMNGGVFASVTSGGAISGSLLDGGVGAFTVAPGGVGTIGQLNLGGLTTNNNTSLAFDLTTPGGSGDLIVIGSHGLTVNPSTDITFSVSPSALGDYRLIGGSFGTPTLTNFVLPTAPGGETYALSTAVDAGYIDLVVANLVTNTTLAATAHATLSNSQVGTFGQSVSTTVAGGATYKALGSSSQRGRSACGRRPQP